MKVPGVIQDGKIVAPKAAPIAPTYLAMAAAVMRQQEKPDGDSDAT